MKLVHLAITIVIVFACIWASNNIKFVANIVG